MPDQAAPRRILYNTSAAAPARHRSLQAMIDSSYELCTPAEQLLWNRVSVFAGSFGLDAAEEVCSGEGIAPSEAVDLLDRLIAQSIVLLAEAEGRPCYRLLESIREFDRERLADTNIDNANRRVRLSFLA